MPNLHPWPDYIIRKGFFLSSLLVVSALLLSVWADARPVAGLALRHYISSAMASSAIVLAAALPGGLFLEDILRRSR